MASATFMGIMSAIGTAVSVVSSIAGLMKGSPDVPQFDAPPEPSDKDDSEIQAKAKEERLRRSRSAGLSGTVLTSGSGISEEADTKRKTLLGE